MPLWLSSSITETMNWDPFRIIDSSGKSAGMWSTKYQTGVIFHQHVQDHYRSKVTPSLFIFKEPSPDTSYLMTLFNQSRSTPYSLINRHAKSPNEQALEDRGEKKLPEWWISTANSVTYKRFGSHVYKLTQYILSNSQMVLKDKFIQTLKKHLVGQL